MKTRKFTLEDSGANAKVFYHLALSSIDSSTPSLVLDIEKMPEEIHRNSTTEKIIYPPACINLEISQRETLKLITVLIEASSTYMASMRKKLYQENSLSIDIEIKNTDMRIEFVAVNGIGYTQKRNSNARLLMVIVDNKTDEEIIAIKLRKTKVVTLLQIIKSLYTEYVRKVSFSFFDIDGNRLQMLRVENSVSIGGTWIHGREIQKFQDYIERVIYDFKFKVGSGTEMFKYRQIKAYFMENSDIAMISLTRYTKEHRLFVDEGGATVENKFIVNSGSVAAFYLILPIDIGFDIEDTELLEERNETDLLVKNGTIEDKQKISSLKNGDFILNTVESQIVLSVNKEEKFSAKNRKGKLSLSVRYRDFLVNDEEYRVGRTNQKTGNYENVNKLPIANIDLRIDWLYIFALCAESVHSGEKMHSNEFGNSTHTWKFSNESFFGAEHHSIKVVTDKANKAPVVLLIDHFIDEAGEYYNSPLPSIGGSRMRIPLFKEHIRTILKGLIGLSSLYDDYYWQKKFPVYSETAELTGESFSLGIKRFKDEKSNTEKVSFGLVGRTAQQIYLTESDRDTLFFSAYYRLMYGRWIQFSGEQISISFDGWLTDRYNEYEIEFDIENSVGSKGSMAALAILFATSRNKQYKKGTLDEASS